MSAHSRDIHGREWSPCPNCPHSTPGACASRRHSAFCRHVAADPARWGPIVAAQPGEHRPAPEAPPPAQPPAFRRDPARINVAFVGNGYWAQGGTERWHQTLIPRLAAMPPGDIHIVGYAVVRECSGPPIRGRNGEPIPIGGGYEGARAALALADVAICWGLSDLPALLPAVGGRCKVIGVSHGSPDSPWNREVTAGMAPACDVRAAVSGHAARAWPGGADGAADGAAGVVVIPNGVDPASMAPSRPREAVRASLGVAPHECLCLAVGWVTQGKRVHLAAEAVARLGEPFRLFVAGDGHLRDEVQAAGGERTVMLGRREDIADLMHAADLLVHPSESEGMALVHVEAQFAGLPIVSTPVGHMADRSDLARLVPIDAGPAAWAAALVADWYGVEERRSRAEHARSVAWAEYTADVFAARWAELIRSLLPAPAVRDLALQTETGPTPTREPAPLSPTGLRVQKDHTPPTAGRQAAERHMAAMACDYRVPLSVPDRERFGCKGGRAALCLLRKSHRPCGTVLLEDCVACVGG